MGNFEGFSSRWGGRMAAAIGGAFAVHRIADFGAELFRLGQNVEVANVKIETVFEGSASTIRQWADANNESFGLTDTQLAGLAANFGDLLKPMGFTAAQAAEMSSEVVGLSGALSAWSGGQRSAAEVAQILGKAMLGERESLKELGISIMQADVDARVAAMGMDHLTGAALQQAKAIATQQLIFEKSTDAQRAWTDGSMENVRATNELKAAWNEAKESMAEGLLPVFNEAVQMGSRLVGAFQEGGLSGLWDQILTEWNNAWPSVSSWIDDRLSDIKGLATEVGDGLLDMLGIDPTRFESGLQELQSSWDPFWQRVGSGFDRINEAVDESRLGSWFDDMNEKIGLSSADEFSRNFKDGLEKIRDAALAAIDAVLRLAEIGESILGPIGGGILDILPDGISIGGGPPRPMNDFITGAAEAAAGSAGGSVTNRGKDLSGVGVAKMGVTNNFYGYTDDAMVKNVGKAVATFDWGKVSSRSDG